MEAERHMLEPRHGAVALLGTLRDLGIKIGLLSDCTPEILDLWSELHMPLWWTAPFAPATSGGASPPPY